MGLTETVAPSIGTVQSPDVKGNARKEIGTFKRSRAPGQKVQDRKIKFVNLHERVAIRPRHSESINSLVLSIIRPIRRIPRLVVHRAIQPLWNTIFRKDIRIEENLSAISLETSQTGEDTYTCHITSIRCWMLAVVRRLHITRVGTCLGVIALALAEGKVLVTHVATGRGRGVDCAA